MARGLDHLERVGAEGNGVVLLQVTAHGRLLVLGELLAHKLLGLLREGADERLVVLVKLHLQAPGVEHKLVANVVVHVSVGGQQVYGAQVVALYIVFDGLALSLKLCATVDDDSLLCLIAHHVTVLLYDVAYEAFYL